MKNFINCCFGFVALTLSCISYAATSGEVTLSRIAVKDNGSAILWSQSGWGSASNNSCSSGGGVLVFDSSTEAGKSLLSLALMAYASGKNVIAVTKDSQCLDGYVVLERIDVL